MNTQALLDRMASESAEFDSALKALGVKALEEDKNPIFLRSLTVCMSAVICTMQDRVKAKDTVVAFLENFFEDPIGGLGLAKVGSKAKYGALQGGIFHKARESQEPDLPWQALPAVLATALVLEGKGVAELEGLVDATNKYLQLLEE